MNLGNFCVVYLLVKRGRDKGTLQVEVGMGATGSVIYLWPVVLTARRLCNTGAMVTSPVC